MLSISVTSLFQCPYVSVRLRFQRSHTTQSTKMYGRQQTSFFFFLAGKLEAFNYVIITPLIVCYMHHS